jgi:thiol-disulfide isomerase/thioredoxin
MRCQILFQIVLAGLVCVGRADEKFPVLQAGDCTYSNVTVIKVTATDVFFDHASGMANVKIKTLSPKLQKHFNFDSGKAQAAELKLAENKIKYHDQLVHQPAVRPPDMTRERSAAAARAPELVWRNDFPGALKQAQLENKLVLLDFTGSDWCGWCIKFDQDVLATPKFAAYATTKLQLVKVDFPHHTPQNADLKRANDALSQQFSVDGFPTFVLVDGNGKELGRQVGYLQGGPEAFISELEGFSKR